MRHPRSQNYQSTERQDMQDENIVETVEPMSIKERYKQLQR